MRQLMTQSPSGKWSYCTEGKIEFSQPDNSRDRPQAPVTELWLSSPHFSSCQTGNSIQSPLHTSVQWRGKGTWLGFKWCDQSSYKIPAIPLTYTSALPWCITVRTNGTEFIKSNNISLLWYSCWRKKYMNGQNYVETHKKAPNRIRIYLKITLRGMRCSSVGRVHD